MVPAIAVRHRRAPREANALTKGAVASSVTQGDGDIATERRHKNRHPGHRTAGLLPPEQIRGCLLGPTVVDPPGCIPRSCLALLLGLAKTVRGLHALQVLRNSYGCLPPSSWASTGRTAPAIATLLVPAWPRLEASPSAASTVACVPASHSPTMRSCGNAPPSEQVELRPQGATECDADPGVFARTRHRLNSGASVRVIRSNSHRWGGSARGE